MESHSLPFNPPRRLSDQEVSEIAVAILNRLDRISVHQAKHILDRCEDALEDFSVICISGEETE